MDHHFSQVDLKILQPLGFLNMLLVHQHVCNPMEKQKMQESSQNSDEETHGRAFWSMLGSNEIYHTKTWTAHQAKDCLVEEHKHSYHQQKCCWHRRYAQMLKQADRQETKTAVLQQRSRASWHTFTRAYTVRFKQPNSGHWKITSMQDQVDIRLYQIQTEGGKFFRETTNTSGKCRNMVCKQEK